MIPSSYFYIVDIETDEPLAMFSAAECRTYSQLHAIEVRIRADHDVDNSASGLALRDSASAPLAPDVAIKVMRQQARRHTLRK
jgi:hypothetical protein